MRYLLTFLVLSMVFSCTPEKKGNPKRFVYGTFEIPAGNGYGKTTIIRKDSLQIETYTKKVNISTDSLVSEKEIKHTDTLFIKWKNNFAYSLRMKSPKTDLDKDPIFVQITKVTDSSFSFTARIGYSNFKQNGTVYKVK
ncbi:hypothetical protein PG911_08345 [Tenacibaculum ovolyticum]|uniref:hypothetical protein n=1 Tax=Tenacibaculum ovolyticum TaxID=104270 RepID=UPI0022F3DB87|nr:hypothetical protein [Tenacibaculum ovolyticum]WBX78253.1 hypothetical protein PG911_08345 [Tenacibaculum ovolyticum]